MPGTGSIVATAPAGLRLIGVNRPGYEQTTPAAPGFATAVSDALFVADQLGVGRFAVLGFSGGGPFAAAVAAAAPERVTALGIAAGLGPWRLVEPAESWDPADAALIDLASAGHLAEATEGFRRACAAGFGPMLSLSDDALADATCPPEADPDFRRWAVADTRAALATCDGLVRDNLTLGLPWDLRTDKITRPTFLWYGDADDLAPVSHGRWYAEQIPHAGLTVRAGEGHGRTCFGHWSEMLEALVPSLPAG
jgi:pimeloyl-ACP methyl ester carboxylesterase